MLFGLICVNNEADRYLQSCLAANSPIFDRVLVYDDSSTDSTREIASDFDNVEVVKRPDSVPRFLVHEGKFRQDSYETLERLFQPMDGDWIFVFDADEFIMGADLTSARVQIDQAIFNAEASGAFSVRIPRPEVWVGSSSPQGGRSFYHDLYERIDGYWGTINCTRLFKWAPGGKITDKAMGCGNEPTYVYSSPVSAKNYDIFLVHVGYLEEEDRHEKYERYTSLLNHGHNDSHIQSILQKPKLRELRCEEPVVWRGFR